MSSFTIQQLPASRPNPQPSKGFGDPPTRKAASSIAALRRAWGQSAPEVILLNVLQGTRSGQAVLHVSKLVTAGSQAL